MELLSPIDTIKGVGEKTTKLLNKLGVYNSPSKICSFNLNFISNLSFFVISIKGYLCDKCHNQHNYLNPDHNKKKRNLNLRKLNLYTKNFTNHLKRN